MVDENLELLKNTATRLLDNGDFTLSFSTYALLS